MPRITKLILDAAEPREKRYTVFDSDIRGFGLRVFPSGAKSWVFEYRPPNGGRTASKRRVLIGDVGDFTPDQARKVADQHRTTVKTGGDPQAAKNAWRAAPTVQQVADLFLAHVRKDRAASTADGYERVLQLHVGPRFGAKKAMELSHFEVAKLHREMEKSPAQANKMLRVLSAMFNWAASPAQGRLVPKGTNPTEDIERYPEHAREMFLSPDELDRLGDAIRRAETIGVPWVTDPAKKAKHLRKNVGERVTVVDRYCSTAIRLLLFTGARLREILNLRWSDIDWDAGEATVWKHKTKSRTGKPKIIPLSPGAVAVLRELDDAEKKQEEEIGWRAEFVVAGAFVDAPRADLQRPWDAIRRAADLRELRLHDLRHSFASIGLGNNLPLPLIGKLLGHASMQSTERYAHLLRDPQHKAVARIGRKMQAALRSDGPPPDRLN